MTIDVDLLGEVYSSLKEYIPAKDRQEAADALMSTLVDYLGDVDLKEFSTIDSNLRKAFKEYADYNDTGDESEYDE